MKKPPSKAQLRAEIEQQVQEFIREGGEVAAIRQGISGRENALAPLNTSHLGFERPKQERTYLPEVIAQLDARKQRKPERSNPRKTPRRPRKRLIYDDFGEPLRWEWVED